MGKAVDHEGSKKALRPNSLGILIFPDKNEQGFFCRPQGENSDISLNLCPT